MKRRLITWTTAVAILGFPVVFLYFSFTNSVDCSQLVVDTYEVHSNINIPKVEFVNCYYDEASNSRISVYELNAPMELSKFELSNFPSNTTFLQGMNLLAETERPNETQVYFASGEKWGNKWTYVVDSDATRLWAELKYED